MKTTSAWLGMVGILAIASGCDSEVVGGGGGAGGGGTTGGDGGAAATGTSVTTGEGASSGETTGTTGPAGSTSSTGTGGSGGGNTLGECEGGSGTGATSTGVFECSADYTCDGGEVTVTCLDDGTSETCDCYLDGDLAGSCVEENDGGCSLPVGCCYALLGGTAQPNPGPYGACENDGGSSATSSVGGDSACGATYTCDGGELWIDCSGDAAGATCECRDGQGFLLATCEQASVDCDYASGCCFDLVN